MQLKRTRKDNVTENIPDNIGNKKYHLKRLKKDKGFPPGFYYFCTNHLAKHNIFCHFKIFCAKKHYETTIHLAEYLFCYP